MDQIPPQPNSSDLYYTLNAAQWTEKHSNVDFWKSQLSIFKTLLPEGYVLEIGTGGGRDASQLIKMGYGYKGIEPSGMAEVSRVNLPGIDVEQIHVEDINYPGVFDGFWASASLLHHPKKDIDKALQKINESIKEGGVGFIAIKKHTDDLPAERMETDEFGERFFALWLAPEFKEVLKRNGFEIALEEEVVKGKTTWLVFFVRKVKES